MKVIFSLLILAAVGYAHSKQIALSAPFNGVYEDEAEIEGLKSFLSKAFKVGKCTLRNYLNKGARNRQQPHPQYAEAEFFKNIVGSFSKCLSGSPNAPGRGEGTSLMDDLEAIIQETAQTEGISYDEMAEDQDVKTFFKDFLNIGKCIVRKVLNKDAMGKTAPTAGMEGFRIDSIKESIRQCLRPAEEVPASEQTYSAGDWQEIASRSNLDLNEMADEQAIGAILASVLGGLLNTFVSGGGGARGRGC